MAQLWFCRCPPTTITILKQLSDGVADTFYSGFDDEEIQHRIAKYDFSGDPLLTDLKDFIGSTTVPLYLHRFLKDHGTGPIMTKKLNPFETSLTEEIRLHISGFLEFAT
jgi:hypothetical protein